jgi:hypothetical protein
VKDSVFKKLRGTDRLPNSRRGIRKNVGAGSLRNSTAICLRVSFKKLNKPESFKRKNLLGGLDSKLRAVILKRDGNIHSMKIED